MFYRCIVVLVGITSLFLAWRDAAHLNIWRYRVFFIAEVVLLVICIVATVVDILGFGLW